MATAHPPPSPPRDWLTGHLSAYRRDPLGFLTHCARHYGEIMPLRFGLAQVVFLNHPRLIEDVLVTQHGNFSKGIAVRGFRPLLGEGLLLSEGEMWRRQRRLAQPAFHRQRIAAYGAVMVDYTERMLGAWRDGEVRDIHQELTRLTLAIVAKTLFDVDITGDAAAVGKTLTIALEETNARMNSLLGPFFPVWVPTPGNRRLQAAVRRLDALIYRIIAERRASGEDAGDLLSMLLHAQEEADGSRMTGRQVRDEAMTLFLAGHETTALALSWASYLLAQHPGVEARLVDELETVLGGRVPTVADLPQLRYTEMVVQEALRLYPPAWALGRQARQDCVVGGYPVRAGTSVLLSQWVMQRDARYFAEPEAFHPDRWADGLAQRLPRFAYFPFGGGPRLCIGQAFAMMEAVLVLATVVQRYRLTLTPGHTVTPVIAVSLRPKGGLPMVLQRRRKPDASSGAARATRSATGARMESVHGRAG